MDHAPKGCDHSLKLPEFKERLESAFRPGIGLGGACVSLPTQANSVIVQLTYNVKIVFLTLYILNLEAVYDENVHCMKNSFCLFRCQPCMCLH